MRDETEAASRAASASPDVRPERPSARSEGAIESDILRRLNKLATSRMPLVVGKVQVVNIESIAAHFGNRWPALAGLIQVKIDSILRNRLAPDDVFTRYGDLHYIVVFADTAGEDAKSKIALLGREIRRAVLGSVEEKVEIAVSTVVATRDGALALKKMSTLEALAAFVDSVGERIECPENERNAVPAETPPSRPSDAAIESGASAADLAQIELRYVLDLVDKRLRDVAKINKLGKPAVEERQRLLELTQVLSRATGENRARVAETLGRVRTTLDSLDVTETIEVSGKAVLSLLDAVAADTSSRARAGRGEARFTSEAEGLTVAFAYVPVWSVWNKAITTYLHRMSFVKNGRRYSPDQLRIDDDFLNFLASADICAVDRVAADIADAAKQGRVNIVCIPVHFSTLSLAVRRDRYELTLRSLSEDARRYIVWEIVDTPDDAPSADIRAAAASLKPFGRIVMWRTDLFRTEFMDLAHSGIKAVGADLRRCRRPEDEIFAACDNFAASAEKCGLRFYLHGIDTLSLATSAICTGASYLSGDAIAPDAAALNGVVRFDSAGIYLRLMAEQ